MYLGRLIEVLIFSASHVFELSTLYTSGDVKRKAIIDAATWINVVVQCTIKLNITAADLELD